MNFQFKKRDRFLCVLTIDKADNTAVVLAEEISLLLRAQQQVDRFVEFQMRKCPLGGVGRRWVGRAN
jgi:hypothetical protein